MNPAELPTCRGPEAPEDYARGVRARVRAAAKDVDRQPTPGQKSAGNYAKGHVYVQGLDLAIENPKGSYRCGVSKSGRHWSVKMACHYGYLRRSPESADGESLDVFLGPHPESEIVFVVDQVHPESGRWDEHKVILGTTSAAEARRLYLANYPASWQGLGALTPLTMAAFKKWLAVGDTTRRLAPQVVELYARAGEPEPSEPAPSAGGGAPAALPKAATPHIHTPAFKAWFGDWSKRDGNHSKVVHPETGEPLKVFHGSPKHFEQFDPKYLGSHGGLESGPGYYFAENPQVSNSFNGHPGGASVAAHLNIRNPWDFDERAPISRESLQPLVAAARRVAGDGFDEQSFWRNLADMQRHMERYAPTGDGALSRKQIYAALRNTFGDWEEPDEKAPRALAAAGYDGIVHHAEDEGGGVRTEGAGGPDFGRVWVAFHPHQIKSATGNSGAFDPADPRLAYQRPGRPDHYADVPVTPGDARRKGATDPGHAGSYAPAGQGVLHPGLEKTPFQAPAGPQPAGFLKQAKPPPAPQRPAGAPDLAPEPEPEPAPPPTLEDTLAQAGPRQLAGLMTGGHDWAQAGPAEHAALDRHLRSLPLDQLLHTAHFVAGAAGRQGPHAETARRAIVDALYHAPPGPAQPLTPESRPYAAVPEAAPEERHRLEALLVGFPKVEGVDGGVYLPKGLDLAALAGPELPLTVLPLAAHERRQELARRQAESLAVQQTPREPWQMTGQEFASAEPRPLAEGNEAIVQRLGNWVIKTPRYYPKAFAPADVLKANYLSDFVPPTYLVDGDSDSPRVFQQHVDGRPGTEREAEALRQALVNRGVIPRDLRHENIVVDERGKPWVIDVGNFEFDHDKLDQLGVRPAPIPVGLKISGGDLPAFVHRKAVESALAAGRPVPPEVLADYPDLAPKAPGA